MWGTLTILAHKACGLPAPGSPRCSPLAAILSRSFPWWHHARHRWGDGPLRGGRKEMALMSLVRRYPLAAFVVLACALSWWPWILYSLDLLPTPIVGFGPFLAALVVLAVTEGKRGVLGLLRRMVRWRVGLQWYAAALLLPILVTLAAAVLNVFLLGAQRTSSVADLGGWSSLLLTFLLWLLIPGLAGTWEEPGFRGYALPRLQARHSALAASLILGVLWAFWHLPFVVTGEDIWIDALLFPIEWSIVYTWLFNNAKGSVLIVMLFHAIDSRGAY